MPIREKYGLIKLRRLLKRDRTSTPKKGHKSNRARSRTPEALVEILQGSVVAVKWELPKIRGYLIIFGNSQLGLRQLDWGFGEDATIRIS